MLFLGASYLVLSIVHAARVLLVLAGALVGRTKGGGPRMFMRPSARSERNLVRGARARGYAVCAVR